MNNNKKEMAVAALKNGIVIDHIPSSSLFKVVNLLGLDKLENNVTIGNNFDSGSMGKKGFIKLADIELPEETLNRIAVIAPNAVINIIRDYEVVKKHPVELRDSLIDIVKCNNPKCISNNEPMRTHFHVIDRSNTTLRCHYCERLVKHGEINLK
ncbi:MAG: aspartate carbamoyltransferase regulatory subunit [Prevotella sp.]|nr:aspartate carbamoyltransferase regulatory subunit [Prevotella sp.]MDY6247837.1 aspartate carbamoyltransferase regulatory subunit [Prevotella sp.]